MSSCADAGLIYSACTNGSPGLVIVGVVGSEAVEGDTAGKVSARDGSISLFSAVTLFNSAQQCHFLHCSLSPKSLMLLTLFAIFRSCHLFLSFSKYNLCFDGEPNNFAWNFRYTTPIITADHCEIQRNDLWYLIDYLEHNYSTKIQ